MHGSTGLPHPATLTGPTPLKATVTGACHPTRVLARAGAAVRRRPARLDADHSGFISLEEIDETNEDDNIEGPLTVDTSSR